MKKNKLLSSFISLIVLSIPIFANATVGGETLVYDFKYNPSNESIYYTKTDGGGKGCPPYLMKISLNSEKSDVVFSCDEGIEMSDDTKIRSKINSLYSNFRSLNALNFKKNIITTEVTYIKSETYDQESKEVFRRYFIASVYQNGKKVKEFPLSGCYMEQPFTFQGYSIPGFDKKILILVSAIGNCAEGGYVNEHLEIVGGVDNLDKTGYWFYKSGFPIAANIGNIVAYATENINAVNSTTASSQVATTTTHEKILLSEGVPAPINTVTKEIPQVESFLTRLINWFKNLL